MTQVHLTGTVFYNFMICLRKAWLMQYQISPEHEHDLLEMGRLINEATYERAEKEWELPGMKVDQIRREGDELVLGEVKKSSKGLDASILQLAYYLHRLTQEKVKARGEILIPKERKKIPVILDDALKNKLTQATEEIEKLLVNPSPPKARWIAYCPNCAYSEFCWSGGESEEK